MNKIFSKISAVIMSAVIVFGTVSCGKNEDTPSRSYIYSAEEFEIPNGVGFASRIFAVGENIAVLGLKGNENASEIKLDIFDTDGKLKQDNTICSIDISAENFRLFEFMNGSADGNIISAEVEFNSDGGNSFYLVKYSSENGKKLFEIKLFSESLNNGYDGIFCDSAENVFIYGENLLTVFDGSGNFLGDIEYPANAMERSVVKAVYETSDGKIFAKINSFNSGEGEFSGKSNLVFVDTENMTFGEEFPISAEGTFLNGTYGFDLISQTETGFLGYDIETGETDIIIDRIKSGIGLQSMSDYGDTAFLPDGRIAFISGNDEKQTLIILTEADISKLPDKKKITLYAIYLYDEVKDQAIEFNKNNPLYEIEITEYAADQEDRRNGLAAERLNLDLIAGKIPDIIEFDTGIAIDEHFPKESYMSKGFFADLYEFMDNDPSFNKDEFLPNIFKAFEFDGKLYEAVPIFEISTLLGRSSIVGDKQGWTMEEFLDFAEKHKGEIIFNRDTSEEILTTLIGNNCGDFIDWEKGECHFDNENFARLLEVCASHPAEKYAELVDPMVYSSVDTLLSVKYVIRCHNASDSITYGEDYIYKGYPKEGSGSSAVPVISLGITSKSENQQGAWEFVKSFFAADFQDKYSARFGQYYLPVKKSVLEEKIADAEAGYYFDENGEKAKMDEVIVLSGGTQIPVPPNTKEDSEKMRTLINSVTSSRRRNPEVTRIINEEAAAFFAGQKSAKEVAEIIQNRVSNYLAEIR